MSDLLSSGWFYRRSVARACGYQGNHGIYNPLSKLQGRILDVDGLKKRKANVCTGLHVTKTPFNDDPNERVSQNTNRKGLND